MVLVETITKDGIISKKLFLFAFILRFQFNGEFGSEMGESGHLNALAFDMELRWVCYPSVNFRIQDTTICPRENESVQAVLKPWVWNACFGVE